MCAFCRQALGPPLAPQKQSIYPLEAPEAYLGRSVSQSHCTGSAELGGRLLWQLAAASSGYQPINQLQKGRRLGCRTLCESIAQLQGALLQHHRHIAASGVLVTHADENMWGDGL